ncbi:hypothetical protein CRI94_14045 [Longibacter salinarum]|uniref:non-specific protein-tyrosine kinase n=1 Tax=Longibacter salinarum TaxID=1850348 RepID=A0A2A8CVB6_9BACT|nr:polysaccharide biosynthesis tyrosine autokinase [Longibacter salinarum]PEN12632.1 hypothetical protein CRI94_14045 [Longibacter salinarum]
MSPSSNMSSNGHRPAGGPVNGIAGASLFYDDNPQRGSQLHELLGTLWRGKWIILGVLIVVLAAGTAYTLSIPTTYRTSSLLLVDKQSQSGGVVAQLSSRGLSPYSAESRTLQNELFVLQQSMTIPNRVADSLLALGRHPETGRPIQMLSDVEGNRLSQNQIAHRVRGSIRAGTYGEQFDAIRIVATGRDAADVALVANIYADEYIRRTKEKARESLQASRDFLERQAEKLKAEVQAAEGEIENYMQREGAIALDQESGRIVSDIAQMEAEQRQLQIELQLARTSLDEKRSELEKIEPQISDRLSSTTGDVLESVQEEKARLQARIDQIERENPNLGAGGTLQRDLRRMKERVSRLQERADSLASKYVNESLAAGGVGSQSGENSRSLTYVVEQRRAIAQHRIEVSGLEARLDAIQNQLEQRRAALKNIPEQSMVLAQLQRERRSTERIYGMVQEKLQETRLAEESEMGYAEVIRPAGYGTPVSPSTRTNLLYSFMIGLVLGGGIVLVREQLDTRIQQPDDLRRHGHQIVGVVPSMDQLIEGEFEGQSTILIDGQEIQTSLAMLVSPMSAVAESYRRIRTNLQFSRPDKELRTLAISSAEKGEGKSTTSSNLALALASAGKDTLLVDADLRRPRAHELMGLSRSPGLSHLLYDDEVEVDDFETEIDRLWVLPAGESVPNPAELLGSERMQDVIENLRERFDYILFDTPPVLLFSDALALASHCDGTILVASANRTDGRAFDHAVDLLHDVEADTIGCVLNRYDASSFLQGYGYNYGYAHSYKRLEEHYAEDPNTGGRFSWLHKL